MHTLERPPTALARVKAMRKRTVRGATETVCGSVIGACAESGVSESPSSPPEDLHERMVMARMHQTYQKLHFSL
ncbi:hypothetical protein [Ktedonospora formicarum]|uniref:Uncharacterized protein n=1 Tax=Ktedonospora formicarum TaxID=2778364 RepID=A0A8J3MW42_9CHLR|nr:hypothetical protein [Ktedonospora formicarum]GHO48566.1 hypothetical protein KSX_67290 [Ktedonospora formicarum]